MPNLTWREAERLFKSSGPICHLYSKPLESGFFFDNDEERKHALLLMALAADFAGVVILAFAIMSNHFHFIIKGERGTVFFSEFRLRLGKYLSRHGKPGLMDGIVPGVTAITSLNQFYDELAYVIRNPYVVSPDVNLLSYPWCSGYLYFNSLIRLFPSRKPGELSYRELRQITKSRDVTLPEWVRITDGGINPTCFVDYKLVENLFRNAREFIASCFKNVETQVEVAKRMDEKPALKDEEMYRLFRMHIENEFGVKEYKLLSSSQRIEVLKKMKFELGASNGQIARVLHLPQSEVDSIFPMTAKKQLHL